MRTDGQTDMTKLIVAFRNFANAPKMDITPLIEMCYSFRYPLTSKKNCARPMASSHSCECPTPSARCAPRIFHWGEGGGYPEAI
jgi:hypothetical protein